MKEEIGMRLKELLIKCNFKSTLLSEKVGKSRTVVSSYLSGRCYPPFEFLIALKKEIPNLNMDWLITGEGNMLHDQSNKIDQDASLKKQIEELQNREREMTSAIIRMTGLIGQSPNSGQQSKSKGVFVTGNFLQQHTVVNTPWQA